jgi:hypothetical protein
MCQYANVLMRECVGLKNLFEFLRLYFLDYFAGNELYNSAVMHLKPAIFVEKDCVGDYFTLAHLKKYVSLQPLRTIRGCGVIGSRARLRIWCREAWGFESLQPHKKALIRGLFYFFFDFNKAFSALLCFRAAFCSSMYLRK